ncbi:Trm112 family protein [Streptomyces sp. NPDC058417]|uniref:Trm112 family protein n=1 Tax=unclassified Streptomyces TaxID=2593676 RepID=UPI00364985F4
MPLEAGLLEILACPACHAPLKEQPAPEPTPTDTTATDTAAATDTDAPATELLCTGTDCALAYPIRDGIPVLLVDEARRPA